MTLREWCQREGHPVVGWDTDGHRCICGEHRPGGCLEELHGLPLADRIAVSSHAVDAHGSVRT
jgi:hypothetical protein